QHNLIDITCLHIGILQCLHDRATSALYQIGHQLLQFGASQGDYQVFWTIGICANKGQVDLRLHGRGQLNLSSLCGFLQALQGHAILAQVDTLLLAELIGQPINNALVEVITTQVGIAISRLDLKDAFTQLQNGDVEGSTAKVIDGDRFVLLLVQTISQRGSGRLVDNAQNL